METFEELGIAIGTVSHDSEALIKRAVLDGRRHLRRRRLGAGVCVLSVGAVVAGSSFWSAGSPGTDGTAIAGQTTTTVATTTAGPSSGGGTGSAGYGRVDLPSADLTDQRLAARLPVPGNSVSVSAHDDFVYVERSLDPDGSGMGSVRLTLGSAPPLSDSQISGAEQKCHLVSQLNGPESCKVLAGGWVFTYRPSHPDIGGASPQVLDGGATAVYKDGTSVSVHATNYVGQADPTRQTPVLDMDQATALAEDPVWFQPAS